MKMQKLTVALSGATVLAAAVIGLAAPAMAATPASPTPHPVTAVGTDQPTYQLVDCSVHVRYQGSDVDVNWC